MINILVSLFLVTGALFSLLAAVGLVRMPDVFTRMQAGTKAATLGLALLMLAVTFHFGQVQIATRALLVSVFVIMTSPVAAQMLAQAAYYRKVALYPGTVIDELASARRDRDDEDGPA
jgi:multicomponent Na+:H+ antiporter subunit G